MGLLSKSAPKTLVGLDIGSDLIKVAEAKAGKNRINLTGVGVAPVPEGTIENGIVIDPQGLGLAVKALLKESGIKSSNVVSSISGQSSLVVRIIEMPKMTPKELGEAMKFEVERQTPFAPSEVVMDYAPIEKPSTPPDAQQMEVLLAAAQQDVINNHLEVLFAAGLKPYAIDIEPLAQSRALIDASMNGVKNATVGIVNIGASKTDFGVFEAGLLTFPNPPIQIAGINITRAVSEALGETIETAETLKKQFAEVDLTRMGEMSSGYGGIGFGTASVQDEEPDYSSPINFIGTAEPEPPTAAPMGGIGAPFNSGFDFGDQDQQEDVEEPVGFRNTVDGPVFDIGGDELDDQPVKPSFDLTDDVETPDPIPPAAPSFDLDDEPAPQSPPGEPTAFSFDLSDESEGEVFGAVSEGTGEPKPAGGVFDDIPDTGGPDPMKPSSELSGTGEPRPMGGGLDDFDLSGTGEPEPMGSAGMDFGDIGQSFDMDEDTAGASAAAPHVSAGDQGMKQQVFEAMAPVLMELATELRRSIEYYRTRFQNQPEKIFITGGTAKIKNLDKFLTNELGIPVEVADPVANLTVTSARYSEQYLKEVSPLFTVSIGLAIREML